MTKVNRISLIVLVIAAFTACLMTACGKQNQAVPSTTSTGTSIFPNINM